MKIGRIYTGLITTVFCLGQAQAGTSAAQDPVLIPQKAISAPLPDYKEIDNSSKPPLAPSFKTSVQGSVGAPSIVPAEDSYPLVSKMEVITFGKEKTNSPLEQRLGELEQEVFKGKFSDQSLFDRTQKLKLTILGPDAVNLEEQDINSVPLLSLPPGQMPAKQVTPEVTYFELIAKSIENQVPVESQELPKFALQLINNARAQLNFPALTMDDAAEKMAEEHVVNLHKRQSVSHTNDKGENPDLRYTNAGGTGAIMESVIALKPEHVQKNEYTRALVAHTFKLLLERQDDRESLLSPDATGFGFALRLLPEQRRAIVCVEVSTTHGTIKTLPLPIKIGDKVDIEGTVNSPYKFAKITLAWEGLSKDMPQANDETEEALPYFPPLDYIGYARKSEHDYGAAKTALRMGLLAGIIAGGVFMPPVAFAAPLVMMAPPISEPKPVSDIPMHGGIKVEGNNFSAKIPLSNLSKPGIYYITVWAQAINNSKFIPISRRALVLTEKNSEQGGGNNNETNKFAKKQAKQEKKEQKFLEKHNKQANKKEKDN